MASRYWVKVAGGTWDNADTSNWSATSGGASGASVPVAGDDVFLDGNSGTGTITLNYTLNVQHFDHTGYNGTFASSGSITITCTGNCIQSATATYTTNGAAGLTISSGAGSRDLVLINRNMWASGYITIVSGLTFGTFSVILGTSSDTGNRGITVAGNITINTAILLDGTGSVNSFQMSSSVETSQRTISLGASCTVSLTNIAFRGIAFSGTQTPVSGSRISDGGFNSGITFPASVDYYWIGGTGSLTAVTTNYSLSSGGSAAGVGPLLQDRIIFDDNSFASNGQIITLGQNWICGMDFSACNRNIPNVSLSNPNGAGNNFIGNLILKAGMTVSGSSTVWSFRGSRSLNFSQNGANVFNVSSFNVRGVNGGGLTLSSDFSIPTATWGNNGAEGSFDTGGYKMVTSTFGSSNTNARSILLRNSTIILVGTGTVWNFGTTTNLTYDPGTSHVIVSDTSSTAKTLNFAPGNAFHALTITPGGSGAIIFTATGNRPINTLNVTGPKTLTFNTSGSLIVNNFNVNGLAGNLVAMGSNTPGTPWTFSKSSGSVTCNLVSFTDCTATGGATFIATHSIDGGGNSGITFSLTRSPATGRSLTSGRTAKSNRTEMLGNLVKNPGFETAPTFVAAQTSKGTWNDGTAAGSATDSTTRWGYNSTNSVGSGAIQFDSSRVNKGSYSLKVSTTATGATAVASNMLNTSVAQLSFTIPIEPSTTYFYSFVMETNYVSGDSADGACLQLKERNAAATTIQTTQSAKVKTTSGRTLYTGTFTTQAGVQYLDIEPSVIGATGAATLIMDAWFDDIYFQKASLVFPRSVA